MDYFSNIKQTYNVDFDLSIDNQNPCYMFLSNGNVVYRNFDIGSNFDSLCYNVANYCNQEYNSSCIAFLMSDSVFQDYTDYQTWYLVCSNKLDYFIVKSTGTTGNMHLGSLYHNEDNASIYDGGYVLGYPLYNPNQVFSNTLSKYGSYDENISNNSLSIIDYTSITSYVDGSTTYPKGVDNVLVVRGENLGFYKYPCLFNLTSYNSLEFSYGSPYADIREQARSVGYGAGYSQGYVNGYDIGYNTGLASQGATTESATAFSYISQAFGTVNNIMSLEVLPNVNLGLCFSIPLVIVLIMTIFKLVRK